MSLYNMSLLKKFKDMRKRYKDKEIEENIQWGKSHSVIDKELLR